MQKGKKLSNKPQFKLFEKPAIEESYDYAEQVRRQIERCLAASSIEDDEIRDETYEACILSLENLVPIEDRDEQFEKDLEDCSKIIDEDIRPEFGGVLLSIETCDKLKISTTQKIKETDWNKYFRVLFNKFVALKVTVRRGSYNA